MIYNPALCWTIIWTIRSIRGRLIVLIDARTIRNDQPIRKHCFAAVEEAGACVLCELH